MANQTELVHFDTLQLETHKPTDYHLAFAIDTKAVRLNQSEVKELVHYLQHWLDTGQLHGANFPE